MTDGLVEAGLTYASAGAFSTPRRLVLSVDGLTAESRPVREERKGPRADCARGGGGGVPAVDRADAATSWSGGTDKKGEIFYAVVEKPGRPAPAIVAEVLERRDPRLSLAEVDALGVGVACAGCGRCIRSSAC